MSKLAIRISVIAVSVYLILCYICDLLFQIEIWSQTYHLLFEACVCLCISKQGVYHCRFIKWTAYAILLQDAVVCSDVLFDYLPVNLWICVPVFVLTAGLATTTTLAVRHYWKVRRLKKKIREI